MESPAAASQGGWRWCELCQGLWFNGNSTTGRCPANGLGGHHKDGSGLYILLFASDGGPGQTNWRWCDLCDGLWFNGNPTNGVCPTNADGHHNASQDYKIRFVSDGGTGQDSWRWCELCEGMWFSGNPTSGVCPSNGSAGHHINGSGEYILTLA